MKNPKLTQPLAALISLAMLATTATAEVSKETLASIMTPDRVETSIGTLKFLDGAPYPETSEQVYDELDRMRGVEAYLKGMPLASIYGIVEGAHSQGAVEAHQVILFEQMLDAQPIYLTGNTSTFYVLKELDLERDGATVVELPAGLLGAINNAWFRYLADFGPFGQDKGQGGKYVILPPGYEGEIPQGHFVVQSDSYHHWIFLRASTADGVDKAVKLVKDNLRIYPLARADNPPAMEFINRSGTSFNTVHANDFTFYEELNAVIQKEPLELLDAETRGLFAAIGIEKGKPFAPDARMKRILTDAVAIGNATARSIVWYPRTDGTMKGIDLYPGRNSAWQMAYLGKNVFFDGQDGHTMNSDARVMFHYPYTAVTPAMAVTIPGKGSDYGMAFIDSDKKPFDGSKTYRLTIPANPPVNNFWSVTLYDSQTRSMLRTGQQFPALDSLSGEFKQNADGSVDIYFGPKAPRGMESNWVATVPGKSWFTILRMYGPLEPWIEKTWRPGEVELVDDARIEAQAEVNQGIPASILTPDQVETSIGTLKFIDGAPYPETAEKVYDYLDRIRGVDAFLKGIPGASVHMLIHGPRNIGAEECHQVLIFDKLLDSKPLYLTANTSNMYVFPDLDLLRDGPTVIEVPAGALGAFNDAWFRYLGDVGPFGPDKGKGGKYLVLPPGHEGEVPEDYFVVRSTSYDVWLFMRFSTADGVEAAVKNAREGLRVYPLARKDDPPKMEFVSGSGKSFNTIHANDFTFYEEINAVIQKEPLELLDAETRGLFASIGIEKGKPFAPDARMKRILTDAVAIGNATARSIVWYPRTDGPMKGIEVYPGQNSAYMMAFTNKNVFFNGEDSKTMNSEARVAFHYPYTAVTPAMAVTVPGRGSDYGIAYVDAKKQPFDGSKTYRLNVPANPPVNDFWSVTLYDSQTRSQLQTSQPFPALDSISGNFKQNADGSVDIYFGPRAPDGMGGNWLETVPGKSFFVALRVYGPLEPWIEKTWLPGEVELVE